MSMELMLKERRGRLVPTAVILTLLAVGLIALVEKGAPRLEIPVDSSPLNPLSYGTSILYQTAQTRYRVWTALNLDDLDRVEGDRCIYAIISPSHPVTLDESRAIVSKLLRRCSSTAILIADEETTSNTLLHHLNSSIRILGNRLVDPLDLSFHPTATIVLSDRRYEIKLDLASEVLGGVAIGVVESAITVDGASSLQRSLVARSGVCVASTERVSDRIDVAVVGDGSIFLNQVLASNQTIYRRFAEDLLDYLCGGSTSCAVVFDAMHSSSTDPGDLAGVVAELSPQDLLYIYMVQMLLLLHPAVWLPPAVAFIDRMLPQVFRGYAMWVSLPLLAVLVLYTIKGGEATSRDEPLAEQREIELYVAPELRRAALEGRIKLDSRDFINLYTMVDTVFRGLVGVGLDDARFPDVVGRYTGVERSRSFWKFMNRYYRRAVRKSLWPPIVFWGRVVKRAVSEGEAMLNAVGSSILQYALPYQST